MQRKLTRDFSQKKAIEISFIDSNIFYNLVQRASHTQQKNSFIIYDLALDKKCISHDFKNLIYIQKQVLQTIVANEENIKLDEIQKLIPQEKVDIFTKAKRFYNFILFQSENSDNLKKFNEIITQIQQSQTKEYDSLLHDGRIKVQEDVLIKKIQENQIENEQFKYAFDFYRILKKNKIQEIHILRNDTQIFFQQYPFMSKYFESVNNVNQLSYPNEVLNGFIYYGNWKHASQQEVLENIGITHILNVTSEVENYFQLNPKINYLKISIDDEDFCNISQFFKETYEFVSNALSDSNNKILIHCAQGKSRSATIVCMYFMKKFQYTLDNVLIYIQDRREVASPNYGFSEQLKQFEKNNYEFCS